MTNTRFEQTNEKIKAINGATIDGSDQQLLLRTKNAIEKLKQQPNGSIIPIPFELLNLEKNRRFDKDIANQPEFFQLVENIREVGLVHRPVISCDDNSIFPLEGHRRILALKHLGQDKIECEVKHLDSEELRLLLSLSANTSRKEWDIIAISLAVNDLYKTGKYTNEKLGEFLNKDRKTIERYRKIANWSDEVLELIRSNFNKLNIKFLLSLAQINLSKEDVRKKIQVKLGLIVEEKVQPLSPFEKKFSKYLCEKKLSSEKIELLKEALIELNIISKNFLWDAASHPK